MDSMSAGTMLLWGGSVRSMAQAARRMGERPVCVDWFGDVDTRACGPVVECRDWEGECADVLNRLAAMRGSVILPLGGTENFPSLFAEWRAFGRVAAASLEAIRRVRDPQWVVKQLEATGLPVLKVEELGPWRCGSATASELSSREWLRKPRQGVAGRGVRRWDGGTIGEDEYLQEFRLGEPVSAGFLAAEGRVELLGVTRQLIGDEFGAGEFGYAGNVLWADCPASVREQVAMIGEVLVRSAGLTGLFGVDGVLDRDEAGRPRWWVCEVNPRPTAAMELWERGGRELLPAHLAATLGVGQGMDGESLSSQGICTAGQASSGTQQADSRAEWGTSEQTGVFRGKRIVYAVERCQAVGLAEVVRGGRAFRPGWVADVPEDGLTFCAGEPICTVFAEAESHEACVAELDRLSCVVRERYVRAAVTA